MSESAAGSLPPGVLHGKGDAGSVVGVVDLTVACPGALFADEIEYEGPAGEALSHGSHQTLHLIIGQIMQHSRRQKKDALLLDKGDLIQPAVIREIAGQIPFMAARGDVLLPAGDHVGQVDVDPGIFLIVHLPAQAGEAGAQLHHRGLGMDGKILRRLPGKIILPDGPRQRGALEIIGRRGGLFFAHFLQDAHRVAIRQKLRQLFHCHCPTPERDAKRALHAVLFQLAHGCFLRDILWLA